MKMQLLSDMNEAAEADGWEYYIDENGERQVLEEETETE